MNWEKSETEGGSGKKLMSYDEQPCSNAKHTHTRLKKGNRFKHTFNFCCIVMKVNVNGIWMNNTRYEWRFYLFYLYMLETQDWHQSTQSTWLNQTHSYCIKGRTWYENELFNMYIYLYLYQLKMDK